jgi:hypothetical protein
MISNLASRSSKSESTRGPKRSGGAVVPTNGSLKQVAQWRTDSLAESWFIIIIFIIFDRILKLANVSINY